MGPCKGAGTDTLNTGIPSALAGSMLSRLFMITLHFSRDLNDGRVSDTSLTIMMDDDGVLEPSLRV